MKKRLRYHIRGFGYAFSGLGTLLRTEKNMLVHLLATLVVIALGWWHGFGATKWCLAFGVIGLVWICEAFNTALERLCNVVSKEYHPVIRQVKDISSAAVLIAAIVAVVTGVLLFFF